MGKGARAHTMDVAICVNDPRKRHGSPAIVWGVDIEARAGAVFGPLTPQRARAAALDPDPPGAGGRRRLAEEVLIPPTFHGTRRAANSCQPMARTPGATASVGFPARGG